MNADLSRLTVRWPDGTSEELSLSRAPISIGRNPDNDLIIPSDWTSISGSHCVIYYQDGVCTFVDSSTNGSFLNDERIHGQLVVQSGQTIRIGNRSMAQDVYIQFTLVGAARAGMPASTEAIDVGTLPMMTPATPAEPANLSSRPSRETTRFPYLSTRWPSGESFEYQMMQPSIVVGRSPDVNLVVPSDIAFVSGRHFSIERRDDGTFVIMDLGSTNGTRVNNRRLEPNTPANISDGAIIRIGNEQFGSSIGFTFSNPSEQAAPAAGFTSMLQSQDLLQVERITIGRDPSSDLVLNSPQVAAQHAIIRQVSGAGASIEVLDARLGALVNNTPVQQASLNAGDVIQIGPHILTYDGEKLSQFDSQGFRMDVIGVEKVVNTSRGKLRILDDISMTIMPREFVALVGGSGAGKSTLLDALNGFRPAGGKILLNGRDFYRDYDAFRTELGYVPQYDILPTSLKVESALNFAARLRLPSDVNAKERKKRITEVLEVVGLNTSAVRNTRISNLSGGQRKRVSIAAELLADPKVFFLDEPTSGLDPGLEKKMMYTLRQMADEGRTILLITHATGNIVQVDHCAFLSQGRLVYFGPPQEAGGYFDVDDFADIYEKIERHGEKWRTTFTEENPSLYQRFVVGRALNRPDEIKKKRRGPRFGLGQAIRQFIVYVQRTLKIILNDPISLVILLGVMPLVAIMLLMLTESSVLVGDSAIVNDPTGVAETLMENYFPVPNAQTMLFSMSLLSVLVGMFGTANELIKERPIYLRERIANLKLLPYLGSKYVVYGGFALVQAALLLMLLLPLTRFPLIGTFLPALMELYITLFLSTMASVSLGLFISSISRTTTQAVYTILIIVFVQLIFAGVIFDVEGKATEPISYSTITRWSLQAMGTTVDLNELAEASIACGNGLTLDETSIAFDPLTGTINTDDVQLLETEETVCRSQPIAPEDLSIPYYDSFPRLFSLWMVLLAFQFVFAIATLISVKSLDGREVRLA